MACVFIENHVHRYKSQAHSPRDGVKRVSTHVIPQASIAQRMRNIVTHEVFVGGDVGGQKFSATHPVKSTSVTLRNGGGATGVRYHSGTGCFLLFDFYSVTLRRALRYGRVPITLQKDKANCARFEVLNSQCRVVWCVGRCDAMCDRVFACKGVRTRLST